MTGSHSPNAPGPGQQVLAAMADVLPHVVTPLLAIDLDAVAHNIARMVQFSGPGRWRPHIKTTKQARIVELLAEAGVSAFKCATLDELDLILGTVARHNDEGPAEADVLFAYPPVGPVLGGVLQMAAAAPACAITVLADNPTHFDEVIAECTDAPENVRVMLDVDVGMARTGTSAELWRSALPRVATAGRRVRGLHGYEGHIRWSETAKARRGYTALCELAAALGPEQARLLVTSGTHSFHHALASPALTEGPWQHQVSPGTLVLSDLRSESAAELLGLRQAAFVLSRVVSKPHPDRITLDAGSKALNPDCPAPGCALVGYPAWVGQTASEEHRPLRRESTTDTAPVFGEVVALVPEHVCTTVNMFKEAFHVRAGEVPQRHPIAAASRRHDPPKSPR